MNESALSVKTEFPMGLSENLASKLDTWEDHVSYYISLSEASNSFSWIKADILKHLTEKFGESSLEQISKDINEPASTIASYVRVARAFPVEKRDQTLSFSHHFQASFADSYDESKGAFLSENRFDWIERAADENLSTRRMKEEIKESKGEDTGWKSATKCDLCHVEGPNVYKYVFFSPTQRGASVKYMLHPDCFQDIINYIDGQK